MNERCKQLAKNFDRLGLDAMLITDDISRRYMTGMPDSAGVALVAKDRAALFTDFRYIEAAKAYSADFVVDMLVKPNTYPKMVRALCEQWGIRTLGFEDGRMTVAEFENWKKEMQVEFLPMSNLLSDLRVCKDEEELESTVRAQRIAERAWEAMIPKIQRGKTEIELRGELVALCHQFGAEKMSFDPVVASGENSAKPHAVPSERVIRDGDFVTFDFGVKINGYCSDMTRTVCVGEPTDEMRKIYDIVLRAQKAAQDMLRAGVTYADFDGTARKLIAAEGYGPAFGHSLSHGIGLEIHEAAFRADAETRLPAGAIVSVEPGIYLEGRFGVRIEDMAFVTAEGSRNLTECPKELIIL